MSIAIKPETEVLGAARASLRAGAHLYGIMGTPLYAHLCERGADDPAVVELVSHGQQGAAPMHLFSAVHYLLLRDPSDALSRFFATLTANPGRAEDAFPDFQRYCQAHREEILALLKTRTVQTTYAERCRTVMPLVSRVADEAGEPLNLIEIGCSAGVLLTFDQYAYETAQGARLGASTAPLTLQVRVSGGAPARIPRIGLRTGLDLHTVNTHSEDERRWLLALSFPEHREQQAALATALEQVRRTPIKMIEGDALATLPAALAATPDPVCVFHSACLMYWPAQAKADLHAMLLTSSRDRCLYRVAIEPSEGFIAEQKGQKSPAATTARPGPIHGEAIITRYRGGLVERVAAARTASDYGSVEWLS